MYKVLGYKEVLIEEIILDESLQPRKGFTHREEIKRSIEASGHIWVDVILRKENGNIYRPISGWTRIKAAIEAGRKTINAKVIECDDSMLRQVALGTNVLTFSMSSDTIGHYLKEEIDYRRKKDSRFKKESDTAMLRIIAKDWGYDFKKLKRNYDNFRRRGERIAEIYKDEQLLDEEDRVEVSKLSSARSLASKARVKPSVVEKIVSETGIQQRGIEKVVRDIQEELKDEDSEEERIDKVKKELNYHAKTRVNTSFYLTKDLSQELSARAKLLNIDRDSLVEKLLRSALAFHYHLIDKVE